MNVDSRVEKAIEIRGLKYNCAQTVIGAYADAIDVPFEQLMKMSEGLGGGIAGTGDTCGVITGAALVLGLIEGTSEPDLDHKAELSAKIKDLIDEFKEEHGTISCFELKGIVNPEVRKKSSTCNELIFAMVRMIDRYL